MALYGVRLVINLFDLCIYRRYLEEFIGNRKTSMEFSVLLLIVCELIGSAVNQMGISWLNFVTMVAILCVYVCQYEAGIVSRLIAVLLYMGIMGISEPAGYLFSKVFMEQIVEDDVVIYYFSAFLVVIFRLAIVEVFCRLKAGKNVKVSSMPKETSYALALIPLCSLISCFLLIEVAKELISAQMVVLCMCIIFVIIITNYIIFLMIEKYTTVEEKQYEEEMIQREILYRNEYYQDMERYQEQIQDIRHDMKNRLTGLLAAAEQGSAELIKDRLQEVLGDIRLAEEIIYSANQVVNAILKVKSIKAKEKEIPMQVTTLLPQRVSVDIGDMGVLYGNLLDNAIEAAMAVEQEKRYVHVESKFQEGRLLLSIKNSKPSGTSSYQQTSKKDKIKHGRGIRSVRKVAEKYGGELLLKDQGLSAKEIVGILEASKEQIHTLGVLDTLEYLKKGGRISAATAFLGGAMAIKPVVAVSEGEIIMLGKARGSKNGNNFLMKEIEKADGIDFTRPFCLGYTGLSDEMLQKYIKDSEALWSGHTDQLPVCSLGATIGTHVGPGAIAVAFFSPQS